MRTRAHLPGCLAAALLLLAGCAALEVHSDQYARADFSTYRTYAWISGEPLIQARGEPLQISALTIRRIREAIEAELASKGYRKLEAPSQADFVVAFTVGTRDRITAESYPLPYNGPWAWPAWREQMETGRSQVQVQTYREGTLSIDIFDGASRQPVWHGWATKAITSSDMSNPGPVIGEAVKAILQRFSAATG